MQNETIGQIYTDDAVFFYDTLTEGKPFISSSPRNHESLFFVTKGTLAYEKQGKTEIIREGCVGYVARGSSDKSSAHNCPAVSYVVVNFNFGRENYVPKRTLPFETVCAEETAYKYEKLFREGLYEYNPELQGSQMICSGILRRIIGMLYNDYTLRGADPAKAKRIEKSLDYLKQNYHRPNLKISELADIASVSEKHFRCLFFDVYKKRPHEFLRDFRLNKAVLLLMNTSKQISEIAVQCGFSDVYSFSHCFKKTYGISPKAYREGIACGNMAPLL